MEPVCLRLLLNWAAAERRITAHRNTSTPTGTSERVFASQSKSNLPEMLHNQALIASFLPTNNTTDGSTNYPPSVPQWTCAGGNRWFIVSGHKRLSFPNHSPGAVQPDAGRPLPPFHGSCFCEITRASGVQAFIHSEVYVGESARRSGQRRREVFVKVINLQCANHGPSSWYANTHCG